MPDTASPPTSRVREVLAAAVQALGGQERPGQIQMAEAVARAMTAHEHLLVQAGTGTGKSQGYLVPALLHDRRRQLRHREVHAVLHLHLRDVGVGVEREVHRHRELAGRAADRRHVEHVVDTVDLLLDR